MLEQRFNISVVNEATSFSIELSVRSRQLFRSVQILIASQLRVLYTEMGLFCRSLGLLRIQNSYAFSIIENSTKTTFWRMLVLLKDLL